MLSQVNGLYIPGDAPSILENEWYMAAVKTVYMWAQSHNSESDNSKHFPVVATGYGYLAMMMVGMKSHDTIEVVPEERIFASMELNLRLKPEDTYTLDGLSLKEAESILNNMTFFNELVYGIPLKHFLQEITLSKVFVPVATYNNDRADQDEEFIAIVEGAHFPFFGIAFSVDRFQFNDNLAIEEDIDHSKVAVKLAQRLANLFVDEARLSTNVFTMPRDEYKALI